MNHEKGMNKSNRHVTFPIPVLAKIILSFDAFFFLSNPQTH